MQAQGVAHSKAKGGTCDACTPLTCNEHEMKLHKNLEKLRLDLTLAEAACRNAEDRVRAYRRSHNAGKPSATREFLAEFDHTALKATGANARSPLACMLGYSAFGLMHGEKNVDIIHGSGAHAKCKVYRLHTQS